jgi:hypothetical protein
VHRCIAAPLYRVPLLTLLAYACGEVNSLEVHSPGAPGGGEQFAADLVPGIIEAPERMSLDDLLQMRVGVRNIGNRAAGPGWMVRVFLSQDSSISPADHQIDQFVTTRDLPADGEDTYLRNKKLSGLEPGQYYLGSIVDVTDVVPELSDSNNTLVTSTSLTLLPKAPEP